MEQQKEIINKEKIYCIDCQFLLHILHCHDYYCEHSSNIKKIDSWLNKINTHNVKPQQLNQNNNCKLFKNKYQ